jgi:hypothetical protein
MPETAHVPVIVNKLCLLRKMADMKERGLLLLHVTRHFVIQIRFRSVDVDVVYTNITACNNWKLKERTRLQRRDFSLTHAVKIRLGARTQVAASFFPDYHV